MQLAQPLMSNDSRPQEISVDTIQVLEKEEATREKLPSTLGEQRIKHEVFIRTTIHPYVIIERLYGFFDTTLSLQHRLEARGPDMRCLGISML